MTALWNVVLHGQSRWAVGDVDEGPRTLLAGDVGLEALLQTHGPSLSELDELPTAGAVPDGARVLAPVDRQEVWAAGVTYARSRDARMEESSAPDHYDRVYAAERPELFFKSTATRVRGPNQPIGVREDSSWDVPEPELAVVVDVTGAVVGCLVGNDVSSRSIEGDNPLYLPQAKVYTGSCALGPCIVPVAEAPPLTQMRIQLRVTRDGEPVYVDEVAVDGLNHEPAGLANWLYRSMAFPSGAILLTGTAIVPPSDFSLRPGDVAEVSADGLGRLRNPVELIRTGPAVSTTARRHHDSPGGAT